MCVLLSFVENGVSSVGSESWRSTSARPAATTLRRPSSWHILLAERLLAGRIDTTSRPDAVSLLCFVVSAYAMHAYSLSCKAFVVGEIHRQHMFVMCHRPARRRRQLQRIGTSCFVCPMPPLHVCIICICTLNNPPSSSRTLNLEIVARRRLIFFLVGGSANPQTDPNTRASHQSRHYSSHTTQLNPTQPNQELYSRYQPLLH